ncbi:MAG TPA: hypothetical protein VHD15_11790 [Hyphomicrobiales bacterium]|nr:hypothetical protein [Hyphomicrobiales bacterium]
MQRGSAGATRRWLRSLRLHFADAAEAVFGPDPGLLRLTIAGRTTISAALTLTALLLLFADAGLAAAAPVGLGFMVSNFANMSVRDRERSQQAVTLVLLAVPALVGVALASILASRWPWAADIGFVVVVALAALARMAGPRWMAVGMVGFIAYFIGDIIRPPLASMPALAIAVAIALASAALARFLLLPDRPGFTLRQVRRHIQRRIGRLLDEVEDLLADAQAPLAEGRVHRLHYELGRLDDAVLVATDQIGTARALDDDAPRPLGRALFVLQLAAERLARAAVRRPLARDAATVRPQVAALRDRVEAAAAVGEPVLTTAPAVTADAGALATALGELQSALAALAAAWAQDGRPLAGGVR